MRAPPESLSPTTGAPIFIARSMTLTILAALVSESEPPKTVKSCAKAHTSAAVDAAVAGHHAVARDDLLGHAEVAAAVGDELVDLLEGAGIEQQVDALARGEPAAVVLPLQPLLAAAQLGAAVQVLEARAASPFGAEARPSPARPCAAACAFSQSLRNCSRPMSVSGCLKHCSMTADGTVTTSAPMRAASTM